MNSKSGFVPAIRKVKTNNKNACQNSFGFKLQAEAHTDWYQTATAGGEINCRIHE